MVSLGLEKMRRQYCSQQHSTHPIVPKTSSPHINKFPCDINNIEAVVVVASHEGCSSLATERLLAEPVEMS